MTAQKAINIPLFSITPNEHLIDYLLNDNSRLVITNPWHTFKGTQPIEMKDYLNVSSSIDKKGNKGYSIKTPHLLYRREDSENFVSNILFTNDAGENKLTTKFKPFQLWNAKEKTDYMKPEIFKPLQKILCSRGKYSEDNVGMTNELVINYQLTQIFEIIVFLKIFGYESSALTKDITDADVVNAILKEFKDIKFKNAGNMEMYKLQLNKAEQDIKEYIKFINPSNKKRFIIENIKAVKNDDSEGKTKKDKEEDENDEGETETEEPFIPDLFKIFSDVLGTVYKNTKSNKTLISYYNALTGEGKVALRPFKPVTYVKYYSAIVDKESQKRIKGYGVYTNYTFKAGQYGNTTTKRVATGKKYVNITPADHAQMAGVPQIGKFWNNFDFDCRMYITIADKAPMCLRYTVKTLLYKKSQFTTSEIDGIDDVEIGMDEEGEAEFKEFGGNPEDVENLDEE